MLLPVLAAQGLFSGKRNLRFELFVVDYLWALQLIDDLEDFGTDATLPVDHNLHRLRLSRVQGTVDYLAHTDAMLQDVSDSITPHGEGPGLGRTATEFVSHALRWLGSVRTAFRDCARVQASVPSAALSGAPAADARAQLCSLVTVASFHRRGA